ncbi:MAG: hypothetical protein HOP10_08625 [Chitinophagaceae bacterium]|nr:hypothetical protein [Chitinophagaceae bacterium]
MKPRFSPFQLVAFMIFFTLFAAVSCKKETSLDGSETEQEISASKVTSESDAQSEIVFNRVFDDAMGVDDTVGMAGIGVFGTASSCPNVTVIHLTANQFPIKVILDFGANGCVGADGHLRKGRIITEYTNRLINPGAIATTLFDGFYFDGTKVEGIHKITNISNPLNTNPVIRKFEIKVENGKLSYPSGDYVSWNSTKIITQFEGGATIAIPHDDAFKVEGNAYGTAKKGNLLVTWQSTIIEPLIKRFNCRWIVKGAVRTTRPNIAVNSPWVAILNFGNGNCDNQAVVTINGVSTQITLP